MDEGQQYDGDSGEGRSYRKESVTFDRLEIETYIDECVHVIRSAYNGISEEEILWRDWNWVNDTLRRIKDDQREARRWDLYSRLACVAAGTNGGTAMNFWQELIDSTFSMAEKMEQVRREEEEALKELEKQRAERAKKLNNGRILKG